MYGGGTPAAARRAARLGMMLLPMSGDPALAEAYDAEAIRVGNPTGMTMGVPPGSPSSLFVADDVDAAWAEFGPYLLHDATAYAAWLGPDSTAASYSGSTTVDALRAEQGSYRIVTPADAIGLIQRFGVLGLHPLCGGLPPALAWKSLRTIESSVLPVVRGAAAG
jgi:alkanesulfonate monooxygenase SsuD/methylene tetrahydromethanopterin reductase-like flavin-dependent oxidoreductase (luciferase family)